MTGRKLGAVLPVFGERHGGRQKTRRERPKKPRKIGSGLATPSAPSFVALDEAARSWDREEYQHRSRQKAWRQTMLMTHAPTTTELTLADEKDRLARLYAASYDGRALARRHRVERRVEATQRSTGAISLRPLPMCRCGHGQATTFGQNGDGRVIPLCRSCALACSNIWAGSHFDLPYQQTYIPGMPGMTTRKVRAEMGAVLKTSMGCPRLPSVRRACPRCKTVYLASVLASKNTPCPKCIEKRFKAVVSLKRKKHSTEEIAAILHISVNQVNFELRRWAARKEANERRRREMAGDSCPE